MNLFLADLKNPRTHSCVLNKKFSQRKRKCIAVNFILLTISALTTFHVHNKYIFNVCLNNYQKPKHSKNKK